jgi:glycosyltransferase involved in cell wall biosynthesis
MTSSIAIVIPTRNRADLAIAAIRSLLAYDDARLRYVVVSNNSSEPEEVRRLEAFCAQSGDARLLHVRPPRALTMAENWDFAAQQALDRTEATHFAMHYDRRLSKPELPAVFDLVDRWPDLTITYLLDILLPQQDRYTLHRMPGSGGVYAVRTARAVQVASQGGLTDLWQSFPVLVNAVTPRAVMERVRRRFGDVCASSSPESCFGFRLAAIEERYLHFDRSLGVHYAFARSNGMGYLRNDTSGSYADFMQLFGERPWLDAAPIPGMSLGQNSFYHEYEMARRAAPEARFPAIEMQGYLKDLARGLPWIADPERQAALRAMLAEHGWSWSGGLQAAESRRAEARRSTLRRWLGFLRADYLPPRWNRTLSFRDERKALRYALTVPSPHLAQNDSLAPLEPVRLS